MLDNKVNNNISYQPQGDIVIFHQKCKCTGLQSAITVEQSQPTLQLHPWQAFSSLSLSQLPGKYTAHYTVLPAGAKHSTIAITAYSQVPIYTPG